MTLVCSTESCDRAPTEAIEFRGLMGHVHDCPAHAAVVREFCDVTHSAPIVDGVCPAVACTGNRAIAVGYPTPLEAP